MKIQINSLEALERLIGNDKEMEFVIKESILNGFAKKYLKSVANSEAMTKIVSVVKEELRKTGFYGLLETRKVSGLNIFTENVLSDEAKNLIKIRIRNEINDIISEEVSKIRETIVQDINSRLNLMATSVSQCIREEVQKETIDKLVQKKLKDLLEK